MTRILLLLLLVLASPAWAGPDFSGAATVADLSVWTGVPASVGDSSGITFQNGAVQNPLLTDRLHGYTLTETPDSSITTSAVVARAERGDDLTPYGADVVGVRMQSSMSGVTLGVNALSTVGDASSACDQCIGHTFYNSVAGLDASYRHCQWSATASFDDKQVQSRSLSVADANGTQARATLAWSNKGKLVEVRFDHNGLTGRDHLDGSATLPLTAHSTLTAAWAGGNGTVALKTLAVTVTGSEHCGVSHLTCAMAKSWRLGDWEAHPTMTLGSDRGGLGVTATTRNGWTSRLQLGPVSRLTMQHGGAAFEINHLVSGRLGGRIHWTLRL